MSAAEAVDRFSAWLTAFGDAWEAADAETMAALFVVGATLAPDPFAPLIRGRRAIRQHLQQLMAGAGRVSFTAEVLGAGHTYGVAHFRAAAEARVLDGVIVCALDARGRCESLRQWWHAGSE